MIEILLPLSPDYDKPLPKESVCLMYKGTNRYANNYTKTTRDAIYQEKRGGLERRVFPGKQCRWPQNVMFDRVTITRKEGEPL